MSNVYWTERFLEEREIDRNDRITKVLTGQMKPSDKHIIENLKERNIYGKHDGKMRVLRNSDRSDGSNPGRSKQDSRGTVRMRRGKKSKKKRKHERKLDALIGEQCPPEFNPVDSVVYDTILTVGYMIIDGVMQSATFKIDGTTVAVKAGKKIEVTRRRVYEQGAEVQE